MSRPWTGDAYVAAVEWTPAAVLIVVLGVVPIFGTLLASSHCTGETTHQPYSLYMTSVRELPPMLRFRSFTIRVICFDLLPFVGIASQHMPSLCVTEYHLYRRVCSWRKAEKLY